MIHRKKQGACGSILACCLMVQWPLTVVGVVQKTESFVVTEKKSNKKAGNTAKEDICRGYADIAQMGAQVVQKVATIQGVGLEHAAQYLDGKDPFVGMTKAQAQELERRSQALEQEMVTLCKHCDEYAQYQHNLFTQKIDA
jgi:hypothetical protein